ncbi:hypothetical protein ANCCAN_13675, partial [Ancylostoma caninum]
MQFPTIVLLCALLVNISPPGAATMVNSDQLGQAFQEQSISSDFASWNQLNNGQALPQRSQFSNVVKQGN